jgi:hypothetical protein
MKRSSNRISGARVDLYKMKALDFILIVMILLGSAGGLLGSNLGWKEPSSHSKKVIIYHDGTVSEKLDLDTDGEISLLDGKMILEICQNRIRIKKSDCPRQVCVHQGWAKYEGESIVCVPFKTLIEIQSNAKPVVDAVAY